MIATCTSPRVVLNNRSNPILSVCCALSTWKCGRKMVAITLNLITTRHNRADYSPVAVSDSIESDTLINPDLPLKEGYHFPPARCFWLWVAQLQGFTLPKLQPLSDSPITSELVQCANGIYLGVVN